MYPGGRYRGSLSTYFLFLFSRPANFSRAFHFRVFLTISKPGTGYNLSNKPFSTLITMERFTRSSLLGFVLTASLMYRTLTTPVATQHSATFDKIAKVNQQCGKNLFLLSTEVNICLPMRSTSKRMGILRHSLLVQSPEHKMIQAGLLLVICARHF